MKLALQISLHSCACVYSQDVLKAFSFFPSPLLGVCTSVLLERLNYSLNYRQLELQPYFIAN